MAKVNGTTVLLYHNGQAIACQQGLNLSINDSIIDISSKDSLGWFNGFSGIKDAKISFKALYSTGLMTDNPKVLSAKNLADSLIAKDRILMTIQDIGFPIIGELLTESLSFDAPSEKAVGLTGSARVKGKLYPLTELPYPKYKNLITNAWVTTDYDTFNIVGTAFTSLINTAGTAYATSNTIYSIVDTGIYKLVVFVTKNSGQLPTVGLWDNTSAYISNQVVLAEGLNLITLTATATDVTASLRITNSAACDLVTSPIYLFEI